MASISDPRQTTLYEIRRLITQLEFELMEEKPCVDTLDKTSGDIARKLFDNFAKKD